MHINYFNRKHAQKITPGHKKVLTLQKAFRILTKSRILIPDKFQENSLIFMKIERVTKKV